LDITSDLGDVAELGCGFGTFSIPVAQRIQGKLLAFDIESAMLVRTAERAQAAGLNNIVCRHRDVMAEGFGLPAGSVDAALLFNILHCESPETLLRQAAHAVRAGGHVVVIHWRYDSRTPRGPDLAIRPKPEQIVAWAHTNRNLRAVGGPINLPPWHYGLRLVRLDEQASEKVSSRD
jgi:SAM-dependent methyltransferase